MIKIEWSKKALKQLLAIDSRYRQTICDKVNNLNRFSITSLDIKKMRNKEETYRLRVGSYRVIFIIIKNTPVIYSIEEIKRRTSTTYLN